MVRFGHVTAVFFGLVLAGIFVDVAGTFMHVHQPPHCACLVSWSSPEDGCNTTQEGCPAISCDDDEQPWCLVANPGCDSSMENGDWAFCNASVPVEGPAPCACKFVWKSEEDVGCDAIQEGCPEHPCDHANETDSWCMVANKDCQFAEEGGDWAFCNASTPVASPPPCVCMKQWTSADDPGCEAEQIGCPSKPCDDESQSWCLVANSPCATMEDGDDWTYCDKHTSVEGESAVVHGARPPEGYVFNHVLMVIVGVLVCQLAIYRVVARRHLGQSSEAAETEMGTRA